MAPSQPCLPHQPFRFIIRPYRIGLGGLYLSAHLPQIPMFKHKLDRGLRGSHALSEFTDGVSGLTPVSPYNSGCMFALLFCSSRFVWTSGVHCARKYFYCALTGFSEFPVNSDMTSESVTGSGLIFRPTYFFLCLSPCDFRRSTK